MTHHVPTSQSISQRTELDFRAMSTVCRGIEGMSIVVTRIPGIIL